MKNHKCSNCGQKCEEIEKNKFFPFCSEQCKLADLWNWLNGLYNISEPIHSKKWDN